MLDEVEELHVAVLAEKLRVSQETIRRDLKELHDRGQLQRVHGGAISLPSAKHRPLAERSRLHRPEKEVIARIAAELLSDGQTVFLGEGTTTLALARRLVDRVSGAFTTHMVDIAQLLARNKENEVWLTGGQLDPDNNYLLGRKAVESIQDRLFDLAITGTSGIDPVLGYLDHSEALSEIRRDLAKRSRRFIVLADHTKFGKDAPVCTFGLDKVDVVVTDRRPGARFEAAMQEAGVEILFPRVEVLSFDGEALG